MVLKKIAAILLAATLSIAVFTGCGMSQRAQENTAKADVTTKEGYPSEQINGIIPWGSGGGTDSVMRPLAAIAEKDLGESIVMDNMTGGIGSIATSFVADQEADGYTLLMGAENPQLYKALDITELSYSDFDPILIIGDETVGIVVGKDSPYKSLKSIIDAAVLNPGTIKLSTTGEGGLPWEVASFLTDVTGATLHQIPYDSDASAREAVLQGECDLTVCKVQSGLEDYQSGNLVFLSMLSDKPVSQLEDVPLIVNDYPNFAKYLPWGPFYGIFVAKGTDPAVEERLSAAFKKAFDDPSYQNFLKEYNINGLGLNGQEALYYLTTWQKNTVTALVNSEAVDKTLSELGIE